MKKQNAHQAFVVAFFLNDFSIWIDVWLMWDLTWIQNSPNYQYLSYIPAETMLRFVRATRVTLQWYGIISINLSTPQESTTRMVNFTQENAYYIFSLYQFLICPRVYGLIPTCSVVSFAQENVHCFFLMQLIFLVW